MALTEDPGIYRLQPWVRVLAERFPGLRLVTSAELGAGWRALVPTLQVVELPNLDPWDDALGAWVGEQLDSLVSDWCWDLTAVPLSLALVQRLGGTWRIGMAKYGKTFNLSVEADSSEGSLDSIFGTFGWGKAPASEGARGNKRSGIVGIEIPDVSPKALPAWQQFLQECGSDAYACSAIEGAREGRVAELPTMEQLLKRAAGLRCWVGPWNARAGLLAALGIPVLAWKRQDAEAKWVRSIRKLPDAAELTQVLAGFPCLEAGEANQTA